jgi:hypothetical protein
MRGIRAFNFPAFDRARDSLQGRGHEVFSPADADRCNGFDPTGMTGHEDLAAHGFDLRRALAADMEFIARHADAVAVLDGWEKSSGARAEVALAHALGLPVAHWEDIADRTGAGSPASAIPSFLCIPADTPPSGTVKPAPINGYDIAAAFDVPPEAIGLPAQSGEVRKVSATGGEKGSKLAQMSSLDPHSLHIVAEIAGFGAQKYSKLNFMRGYDWSLSYDALQRHLHAFWSGQDRDDESGMLHLGHAAWHCLALISFHERGLGTDDRYTSTDMSDLQTKTPRKDNAA